MENGGVQGLTPRDDQIREGSSNRMYRPPIHQIDLERLVLTNKKVISLTEETRSHERENERRITSLLKRIEDFFTENRRDEILEKASLLIFALASGRYFLKGNKGTALVAGLAFLELNGFTIDIRNPDLVSVIDRASVSRATLNELRDLIRKMIRDV